MTDFDYKKYSLENLEKWLEDAINSSEASPQEIYDVIKKVVEENYYCYKNHTERCYELLALLNGNGNSIFESVKAHGELWDKEDSMPPWGHSDLEALRYTEEEMNAMCEQAASEVEKNKCREYNLREAEYYDKRAELDAKWKPVSVPSKPLYVSEDGDVWIPDTTTKEDKVVKWQLPVEVDGLTGECFVSFPDDLLEAADLKEGDTVKWIDRGDGSFELRKVTKSIGMEEC